MAVVTFHPSRKSIEVKDGSTLFAAACAAGLPVASSCAEEFTCGKCNMQVLEGQENLSPQREPERLLLIRQGRSPTDRVSCIALVLGDCTVTTTYW